MALVHLIYVYLAGIALMFIRLKMTKGKLTEKQREWEVVTIILVMISFLYIYVGIDVVMPKTVEEEFTVFWSWQEFGHARPQTVILTYGRDKRIFYGTYTFENNTSYRVKWSYPRLQLRQSTYGKRVDLIYMEEIPLIPEDAHYVNRTDTR